MSSAACGSSCEGRLVERQGLRMHDERRRDRDALPLASGQRGDSATTQRMDAHLIEDFLDALSHQGAGQSLVFEAEGQFRLDVLEDELRFRVLEHEPDV